VKPFDIYSRSSVLVLATAAKLLSISNQCRALLIWGDADRNTRKKLPRLSTANLSAELCLVTLLDRLAEPVSLMFLLAH
jgi:hypothetical protein